MAFGWPAVEIQWAIVLCIATPFVLLASRWLSLGLAHRFNATAVFVLGTYTLGCIYSTSARAISIIAGVALIVSALIFVLGFWGVLTRGYSVALLVALNRLGGCANVAGLENAYSGGRGLHWLSEKRLAGLMAVHVVTIKDGQVAIRRGMGTLVLHCYAIFQTFFRLKDYG